MAYGSVTVLTTATLIVSANTARRTASVANTSETINVYIGPDASITAASGFPLYPTQTRDQDKIPEGWCGPIYGIVSSGTADVRWWECLR